MEVQASAQIKIVSLDVHGARLLDRFFLALAQNHAQRIDYRLRDLVLYCEDILHLAVVALGPQVITVRDVYELGRDT